MNIIKYLNSIVLCILIHSASTYSLLATQNLSLVFITRNNMIEAPISEHHNIYEQINRIVQDNHPGIWQGIWRGRTINSNDMNREWLRECTTYDPYIIISYLDPAEENNIHNDTKTETSYENDLLEVPSAFYTHGDDKESEIDNNRDLI